MCCALERTLSLRTRYLPYCPAINAIQESKQPQLASIRKYVYIYLCINVCSKARIVSLKECKSECSPLFASLFSTRGGPFHLLFPPPCPPASTAPEEGLNGGLLLGSCARHRRGGTRNRLNVGTCAPASEVLDVKRSSEGGVGKSAYDNRLEHDM